MFAKLIIFSTLAAAALAAPTNSKQHETRQLDQLLGGLGGGATQGADAGGDAAGAGGLGALLGGAGGGAGGADGLGDLVCHSEMNTLDENGEILELLLTRVFHLEDQSLGRRRWSWKCCDRRCYRWWCQQWSRGYPGRWSGRRRGCA